MWKYRALVVGGSLPWVLHLQNSTTWVSSQLFISDTLCSLHTHFPASQTTSSVSSPLPMSFKHFPCSLFPIPPRKWYSITNCYCMGWGHQKLYMSMIPYGTYLGHLDVPQQPAFLHIFLPLIVSQCPTNKANTSVSLKKQQHSPHWHECNGGWALWSVVFPSSSFINLPETTIIIGLFAGAFAI